MSDDQFAEIMEREGLNEILQRTLGQPTVESLIETYKHFREGHPITGSMRVDFFCAKGEYQRTLDWLKTTLGQQRGERYEFGLGHNTFADAPLYITEKEFVRSGEVFLVVDGERKCHVRMWD